MNWKKIIILLLVLAGLGVAIHFVNRGEKAKQEQEGKLLDLQAADISRVELRRGGERFLFVREGTQWNLEAPLKAKADKVTLESILDSFASLRYDKSVEKEARDLAGYGLDKPAVELKLFQKDPHTPAATILVGLKNEMDSSSYAKLSSSPQVVVIASYKRDSLERTLFDFRDKRFAGLDAVDVTALQYEYDKASFAFAKKNEAWFMEKPLFSLAKETKVSDIVSAVSQLEAKAFKGAASDASLKEYGLDRPLIRLSLTHKDKSKTLLLGQKGEAMTALASDFPEICEIDKSLLEKFGKDPKEFRESRVARFDAFDVAEIDFKGPGVQAAFKKDKDGNWQPATPGLKGRPAADKVGDLVSALETLEASEFIDSPSPGQSFAYRFTLKVVPYGDNQKPRTVDVQVSAAQGDSLVARNKDLPYAFKVAKDFLDKLPKKAADLLESPNPAEKK